MDQIFTDAKGYRKYRGSVVALIAISMASTTVTTRETARWLVIIFVALLLVILVSLVIGFKIEKKLELMGILGVEDKTWPRGDRLPIEIVSRQKDTSIRFVLRTSRFLGELRIGMALGMVAGLVLGVLRSMSW